MTNYLTNKCSEMFNIFQKFSRSNSTSQSSGSNSEPTQNRNDLEEDGFLVVGKTRSERTQVDGRTFRTDMVDAPPNYNQVSQSYLPSYQDCYGQSPSLDVSRFPGIQHGIPANINSTQTANSGHGMQYGNPSNNSNSLATNSMNQEYSMTECPGTQVTTADNTCATRTALSGIPFELCGALQNGDCLNEFSSSIYQQKQFDYSLYDYDFSLERGFLSEHLCEYRENEGMDVS